MEATPQFTPWSMEPLTPQDQSLRALAFDLAQQSAGLGGMLAGDTRAGVVRLLRRMNCYYSNLIEGHKTTLADIERGLAREFSPDQKERALQHEAKAHVETQTLMAERLASQPDEEVAGAGFIRWLHREFYQRMPEEFRFVLHADGQTREAVEPGSFRERAVIVGRHQPPDHRLLPRYLERFAEAYALERIPGEARLLALAAAHQRLMWIHPFLDGNGRVARLLADAMLTRTVLGYGLWTVSRGLARRREDYYAALARADAPRQGDLDGRGSLSQKGLDGFCRFFLEVCLDQTSFMAGVLQLAGLCQRVGEYADMRAARTMPGLRKLRPESRGLLLEACLRGAVPRGQAGAAMNLHQEVARREASALVREGLLCADTHRAPLRLGFPAHAVEHYFPGI
jgi:Fic family protein